jgi:hypothetical protein
LEAELEVSALKNKHNEEMALTEQQLVDLRAQLSATERESQMWKERTRRDMEMQIKSLYEQHQKEFEQNLLNEINVNRRQQHEKDLKERMEFENDIRAYYEQLLSQSENTLRSQFNRLLAEHEENARKQRQLMDDDRKKELDALMAARFKLEEDQEASRKQFEEELRDKYEKLLSSYKKQIEDLMAARDKDNVLVWEKGERDINFRMEIEEECRRKYEKLLDAQKKELEAIKNELQQYYTQELEKRDKRILEITQAQHANRLSYESEIREKYRRLIEQYQENVKKDQQVQLNRDLEELERKAELEKEKAEIAKEIEHKIQEENKEKYEKIISDLRENWLTEIKSRESKLEARLTEHYEFLLQTKQEQLELALQASSSMDQTERERWAIAMEELRNKQHSITNLVEDKIRGRYEQMLNEYDKVFKKQMEYFETHHTDQSNTYKLDRVVRKYKIALAKWKADYQAQTKEKYENLITELQAKYLREVEKRSSTSNQNKLPDSLIDHETKKAFISVTSKPSGAEKQLKLQNLRSNVQKQWDSLDLTNSTEVKYFLAQVQSASHDIDELLKLYETEMNRLNDFMPLMRNSSRREFLTHRLNTLDKTSPEHRQLKQELESISQQLTSAIPVYEQKYRTTFTYKGISKTPQ